MTIDSGVLDLRLDFLGEFIPMGQQYAVQRKVQ